ncbi:MAG: acyltransferase family protein [Pseudomonadota bacterium]
MQKTDYRPDIEGLRAVAILAVVACHAKLPFMQGGFVGVDIFFVLSGYLITGLLAKEINTTGRVNFLSFYARRFKRLLPGLALMLLVSSLAASLIIAPPSQIDQADMLPSAFLWLSNFKFINASFGYFDQDAVNLFLHTWSLAVEEQFYIVWPALILYFMRSSASLLGGLLLVFAGCLALSIFLSNVSPLWGFYFMPSRGWQFALGGIVCLLATTWLPEKYYSAHTRTLAGFGGLAMILASILLIAEQTTYPGIAALTPSIGAALILFAQKSPVSGALSIKPMQAIGRVSYSWYLWHWPVLILGNAVYTSQSIWYQLFLVAVSLALADIAYLAVEAPIRNGSFKPSRVVLASAALMGLGVSFSYGWAHKSAEWSLDPVQAELQLITNDRPQPYYAQCDDWYRSADIKACVFGNVTAPNTAVLFADSVGTQWFSALESMYTGEGWRLIVLTKSACPIVDAPVFNKEAGGEYLICGMWRNASLKYLAGIKPQVVFIGSADSYEYSDEEWIGGTERILKSLTAEKLYIIGSTPRLPFDAPDCLARLDWQPTGVSHLNECQSMAIGNQNVFNLLNQAASSHSAKALNFNDLVCPDGMCSAETFRDAAHIKDSFVKSLAPEIRELINQAQ